MVIGAWMNVCVVLTLLLPTPPPKHKLHKTQKRRAQHSTSSHLDFNDAANQSVSKYVQSVCVCMRVLWLRLCGVFSHPSLPLWQTPTHPHNYTQKQAPDYLQTGSRHQEHLGVSTCVCVFVLLLSVCWLGGAGWGGVWQQLNPPLFFMSPLSPQPAKTSTRRAEPDAWGAEGPFSQVVIRLAWWSCDGHHNVRVRVRVFVCVLWGEAVWGMVAPGRPSCLGRLTITHTRLHQNTTQTTTNRVFRACHRAWAPPLTSRGGPSPPLVISPPVCVHMSASTKKELARRSRTTWEVQHKK